MVPWAAAVVPLALLAAAAPAAGLCVPTCTVQGEGILGLLPAAVVLASGSTVTWEGMDYAGHIAYEGYSNFDEGLSCFAARFSGIGGVTDAVTFHLRGASLVAEQRGVEEVCTFAALDPAGGSAVLPYQCVLHLPMKGALVVVP